MDSLCDDINIILCGGYGAGKTSVLARISCLEPDLDYHPTIGIIRSIFSLPLKNGTEIKIRILDFSADLCSEAVLTSCLSKQLKLSEGAFILLDPTKKQSIEFADRWLQLLNKLGSKKLIKSLMINKSDLPLADRLLSTRKIEQFTLQSGFADWGYTTSFSEFGDLDISRGDYNKQSSPEKMLTNLILLILQQRLSNYNKLLPIPLIISFRDIKNYQINELGQAWS